MNWKDYKPILVVPTVSYNGGIRFMHYEKQYDIDGEIVSVLWKILSFCDGHRTLDEIVSMSKLEKSVVKEILVELDSLELIRDSRKQYEYFHKITNYPPKYFRLLSPKEVSEHKQSKRKSVKTGIVFNYQTNTNSFLYPIQLNRKSCRSFSDGKLTVNQLGNICDYAYSIARHATPSGGSLFPLKIYCVVVKKQKNFDIGYYEYDAENNNLVLYNKKIDLEQLKYCFNDDSLAFNSPIQIIIAADLDRQSYKYGNRGYRLTLIEAGQVAQNISLYCEEQGLSSCELGGILDIPLANELDLSKSNITPILAIAIGYPSVSHLFRYNNILADIAKEYVGKDKPVKDFGINCLNINDSSFYGAWARYGKNGKRISGATGVSYDEAVCKAIIEGYERYCSSIARVDYVGSAKNSKYFFTPDDIAPLSKEQRELWGLIPYESKKEIEWTKDMTGKYYVPTDFVFYGHIKKNKLFFSDSSGIAAHFDYEEAKKRALAEMIERDAVMRSWYEKKVPDHVNIKLLCEHVKNRVNHWKLKNRDVHILKLDSKGLPVFLTVIVSNEYPCFVSGAAASVGDANKAILKALQEAEYNLLLAIDNPKLLSPKKEDVKTPQDHGVYYHFYENCQKISWLWSGNKQIDTTLIETFDFNKIIDDFKVIFVDLSESPNNKIKVVRAISKNFIPISFGYKRDYYLHPTLKDIKVNPESRKMPHYFA